jgi:hypothetical protein
MGWLGRCHIRRWLLRLFRDGLWLVAIDDVTSSPFLLNRLPHRMLDRMLLPMLDHARVVSRRRMLAI